MQQNIHNVNLYETTLINLLLGNTCKLNKRNAEALYTGKGQLTMRNQNTIEMESFQLNVEDHHKFMLARKNKETGPYFIRIPK
jgi:hypothetical protein